jgi:hypothetical protein
MTTGLVYGVEVYETDALHKPTTTDMTIQIPTGKVDKNGAMQFESRTILAGTQSVGSVLTLQTTSATQVINARKDQIDNAAKEAQTREYDSAARKNDAEADKAHAEAGLDGLKPGDSVIGFDEHGQMVMSTAVDARKLSLQNATKADNASVNRVQRARQYVPLAQTVLKQIDDLDKKGKLGVLETRWNDFLSGIIGAQTRNSSH